MIYFILNQRHIRFVCLIFFVISLLIFFKVFDVNRDVSAQKTDSVNNMDLSTDAGVSMRVLWTLVDYHIGKNAVWGKAEAERMLFKPLNINTSTITFDGKTCHEVTFKRKIVDAAKYLIGKYEITPQTLGFQGETLEVIRTNCTIPGFSEYMRLMNGNLKLVVPIKGVLFIFEPAINY